MKILIIEDDPLIGKTLQKYFERKKLKVDFFAYGIAGLNAYKNNVNDYIVVILDINLPDISGIEIYEEIRKIDKNQFIIFMTGYKENIVPQNDEKILKILLKPFNFEEFDILFEKIKN